MNWTGGSQAEVVVSDEAKHLFDFFSDQFKKCHDNNEYEFSYKDVHTLEEIQKRRGTVETYILIEAYFLMDVTKGKFRFNEKFSRNVNYFRLTINEMLFDKRVQAAIRFKSTVKEKLIAQGYMIDG